MTATATGLSYSLSDEHELLRSTVREFAETHVAPVAEELDREGRFPYDIVKGMAELGIMGITIPEEYGGAGGDTLSYAIAVEELARIDSSVSITMCAHHSLGTLPIYYFGDDRQKQEWLPELASGQKLGAFGLTEPGAGSDAGAARTTARLEGDEWVVNGSKIFITNAGTDISKLVSITAVTGEPKREGGYPEVTNIVIPNGTPGYSISAPMKKMGWHASDTRELSFQDVRVPADHQLGPRGKGFTQFLRILDGGRIGVAALGLGLAQGAYEQALEYAKGRNQFGKPIAGYQAVAFKLADMATDIEASRLLTYKAAWLKDQGKDFSQVAAMAKLKTGLLAREVANMSLQIHGGYGFMDEYPISRFYRDAKILEIGEGTNEVQQMVIARSLGIDLH
jgi:alkylation response protein AidB-like acyl-CoA dehydrogenase